MSDKEDVEHVEIEANKLEEQPLRPSVSLQKKEKKKREVTPEMLERLKRMRELAKIARENKKNLREQEKKAKKENAENLLAEKQIAREEKSMQIRAKIKQINDAKKKEHEEEEEEEQQLIIKKKAKRKPKKVIVYESSSSSEDEQVVYRKRRHPKKRVVDAEDLPQNVVPSLPPGMKPLPTTDDIEELVKKRMDEYQQKARDDETLKLIRAMLPNYGR